MKKWFIVLSSMMLTGNLIAAEITFSINGMLGADAIAKGYDFSLILYQAEHGLLSNEEIQSRFSVGPGSYWVGLRDSKVIGRGRVDKIVLRTDEVLSNFYFTSATSLKSPTLFLLSPNEKDLQDIVGISSSRIKDETVRQKYIWQVQMYFESHPDILDGMFKFERRENPDMSDDALIEYMRQNLVTDVSSYGNENQPLIVVEGKEKKPKWGYRFVAIIFNDNRIQFLPTSTFLQYLLIDGKPHLLISTVVLGTGILKYDLYLIDGSRLDLVFRETGFSD